MKIFCKLRVIRDDVLGIKYFEYKERFEEDNVNNNFEIEDLIDVLLKVYDEVKKEDGKVEQLLIEDYIVMIMNDVFNVGFEMMVIIL